MCLKLYSLLSSDIKVFYLYFFIIIYHLFFMWACLSLFLMYTRKFSLRLQTMGPFGPHRSRIFFGKNFFRKFFLGKFFFRKFFFGKFFFGTFFFFGKIFFGENFFGIFFPENLDLPKIFDPPQNFG